MDIKKIIMVRLVRSGTFGFFDKRTSYLIGFQRFILVGTLVRLNYTLYWVRGSVVYMVYNNREIEHASVPGEVKVLIIKTVKGTLVENCERSQTYQVYNEKM